MVTRRADASTDYSGTGVGVEVSKECSKGVWRTDFLPKKGSITSLLFPYQPYLCASLSLGAGESIGLNVTIWFLRPFYSTGDHMHM